MTDTGLNNEVHGAAVPVIQYDEPVGASSATQDATVCDDAARPPACMHGAPMAPVTGE